MSIFSTLFLQMNTFRIIRGLSIIGIALGLAACGEKSINDMDSTSVVDMESTCLGLTGMTVLAEAIGLPTNGATITTATWIEGEFCKVLGAIHPESYTAPDINFEVNLPAQWNEKSLQFGGGGLNGTLVTGLSSYIKQPESEQSPLKRGYVTMGSDSGHQSAGGFDGNFYLNKESLENYGHMQIKKTHDVAMLLVQSFYGQLPMFNYFVGGSQGGHEAFDVVQRFPDDYDGVVAGYPAHNVVMLHLSALNYAKALFNNDELSWLSPEKVNFLSASVYGVCDELDGAQDGIISNVSACKVETASFKLMDSNNPIRCGQGQEGGDSCLSDAQLEALNIFDAPYDLGFSVFNDDVGNSIFPKWTPFEGSTFFDGGFANLGNQEPAQALQLSAGDATSRLAITQNINFDTINDFDPLDWAGRIHEITPILSANSINLDRFRDNGGKVITFHGLVDDFITPYSSIQYYERLLNRYEQSELSDFYRFYTIPGMGHVTGPFNGRISSLDYLEAWVEEGIAPDELLAFDANEETLGRSRPVCFYPMWPQYLGEGDINQASSFSCVE